MYQTQSNIQNHLNENPEFLCLTEAFYSMYSLDKKINFVLALFSCQGLKSCVSLL